MTSENKPKGRENLTLVKQKPQQKRNKSQNNEQIKNVDAGI